MSPDEGQEELEEVQAEIKKKDEEVSQLFTLERQVYPCISKHMYFLYETVLSVLSVGTVSDW